MTPTAMDYRTLGRSGLKVSKLCLGTMMFGDRPTSRRARSSRGPRGRRQLPRHRRHVHEGRSENDRPAIRADRDHWVLATKVANAMGAGPNGRGLSRKWHEAASSEPAAPRQRLHRRLLPAPGGPRHAAGGNDPRDRRLDERRQDPLFRRLQLPRLADRGDLPTSPRVGIAAPVVCQPYYNAMNRMPEVEQLPACAHFGLGVVPYSPLARGVLTGKYDPARAPPEGTRAGAGGPAHDADRVPRESLGIAQEIKRHAEARAPRRATCRAGC